jgi:uncharacterized protein (TIGR03492 family)
MPLRLLVLSNGHGEDLIALRLIDALTCQLPALDVAVLPLVGLGAVYDTAETQGKLRRVGPRLPLPSGGFSNQSLRGLLADLGAGLPLLSWQQARVVHRWGRRGDPVLAVGDLLPLLLAWSSGGPYGFIGTPKSDHTWQSPPPSGWGTTPLADHYHRCKGSEWDPWEWALMAHPRCRLVAVRDKLTALGLRRHHVDAHAPGNPMMDGFQLSPPPPPWLQGRRRVLLLAGSRLPEALCNMARLLEALPNLTTPTSAGTGDLGRSITVLAATGTRQDTGDLSPLLRSVGFVPIPPPAGSEAVAAWERAGLRLLIGPGRFHDWAPWAEVALATAGTATEQVVGLGVPALSLPGAGPQFKAAFARRQSRLLGGAVLPCHTALELATRLTRLLEDAPERRRLGSIGRRRMGPAGGSERLAALIAERLLGAPGTPPVEGAAGTG